MPEGTGTKGLEPTRRARFRASTVSLAGFARDVEAGRVYPVDVTWKPVVWPGAGVAPPDICKKLVKERGFSKTLLAFWEN